MTLTGDDGQSSVRTAEVSISLVSEDPERPGPFDVFGGDCLLASALIGTLCGLCAPVALVLGIVSFAVLVTNRTRAAAMARVNAAAAQSPPHGAHGSCRIGHQPSAGAATGGPASRHRMDPRLPNHPGNDITHRCAADRGDLGAGGCRARADS